MTDAPSRMGMTIEDELMVNVITAYQHLRLRLTDRGLFIEWPVAVLGVVPVRRRQIDVPLSSVRSIEMAPLVFPSRLVVVVGLVALATYVDIPLWGTALLGLAAILFLFLSFVISIRVDTTETTTAIPVCWLQRKRASQFIDSVRRRIVKVEAP